MTVYGTGLQFNNSYYQNNVHNSNNVQPQQSNIASQQVYRNNYPVYSYPNYGYNSYQYQSYPIFVNTPYNNFYLNNNMQLGLNLVNKFNSQYPNLHSFTMEEAKRIYLENHGGNQYEAASAKTNADVYFKEMIGILEARKDNSEITFDEFINNTKREIAQFRHANCGERAYLLYDELNKSGITNHAIVEIGGNKNYNSHVFNVIGLAENADITRPETWGQNAVVVDTWANRVNTPYNAFSFYKEFLCYGENNFMQFKKLEPDKIFKSSFTVGSQQL